MNKGVIYCGLFPNGKKYYGKTVKLLRTRINEHLRSVNKDNLTFHYALNKYKDSIKWIIIEEFIFDKKENLINKLNEREIYWIEKDKTYVKKYGTQFGYNLTPGGDGGDTRTGLKHSEESKNKIKNTLLGQPFSKERKTNISNSLKGKTILAKNFGDTCGVKNGMYKFVSNEELTQIIQLHQQGLSPKKIAPILNNKFCWAKILKVLRAENKYQPTR